MEVSVAIALLVIGATLMVALVAIITAARQKSKKQTPESVPPPVEQTALKAPERTSVPPVPLHPARCRYTPAGVVEVLEGITNELRRLEDN